jgi:integrase
VRQHDDGSISRERQRDGTFRFRPRLHIDGVRRSLGLFDTIEEAEDALAAARLERGDSAGGYTLASWGAAWLDQRELDGHHRAIAKDRSRWKAHVLPHRIANLPLRRITRADVVRWIDELVRKPATRTTLVDGEHQQVATTRTLSRQTITHARNLVRSCLGAAADRGHVPHNVASGVRLAMRDVRTDEPWTWLTLDEVARIEALPVSTHHPERRQKGGAERGMVTAKQRSALLVAIYAGLRAGELWGLRWADVVLDAERPELVVRHSRSSATKSGRVRRVPLLRPAREALEQWKRVAPGVGAALVWPADDGACHRDGYECGWGYVRKTARIERHVRFHDLRHTCASHLVQGSWGRVWRLEEVRELLGHRSIRTTERYAHLAPGGLHDAARATTVTATPLASVLPIPQRGA